MLHLHTLAALRAALSHYFSDAGRAAWLELFSEADQTRAGRLWVELTEAPIELRTHAQAGAMKPPAVIAQLTERRVLERPLGHTAGGLEASISEQSVELEVFARGAEEAEALAYTTARALQQARGDFLKNGYIFYSLESARDLEPHEAAAAEELGLFVRRLSLRAQGHDEAARLGEWEQIKGPLSLDIDHRGGRFTPTSTPSL